NRHQLLMPNLDEGYTGGAGVHVPPGPSTSDFSSAFQPDRRVGRKRLAGNQPVAGGAPALSRRTLGRVRAGGGRMQPSVRASSSRSIACRANAPRAERLVAASRKSAFLPLLPHELERVRAVRLAVLVEDPLGLQMVSVDEGEGRFMHVVLFFDLG